MGEQLLYVWQVLLPGQERAGGGGVETLHVRLVEDGAVHVRTEEAALGGGGVPSSSTASPPIIITSSPPLLLDLPPPPLQPLAAPTPHPPSSPCVSQAHQVSAIHKLGIFC